MTQANYLCPLCQSALKLTQKTLRCSNNHCFDYAKEGYVNLLPVQFKHSINPGDNKAMVNARRAFLSAGHYQPLADALVKLAQQHSVQVSSMLDAGCGEGFYTHQFAQTFNDVYGIDIAKEAVKKAAKSYKDCHFSVGTLSKLPFDDGHLDTIVSVYAPILEEEFTRVLSKNGLLITVTPAKNHLFELKSLIYDNALPHDEEKPRVLNLVKIHHQKLNYTMALSSVDDRLNLLSMTPFAFKASEQCIEQLKTLTEFSCQADFDINVYQKA